MAWLYLSIAIISEVIGTLALKVSDGFNNLTASAICVIAYCVAFYCLSLVVKEVPVGVAYAVWSGAGIVLVTALGSIFFKQMPNIPTLLGMALIILGVIIINIFSKNMTH